MSSTMIYWIGAIYTFIFLCVKILKDIGEITILDLVLIIIISIFSLIPFFVLNIYWLCSKIKWDKTILKIR